MARAKVWLFGGAAGAASLGATALLSGLISGYERRIEDAGRPESTVYVAVAARDLYPGLPIRDEDLYAFQMAPRFLPEGVFLNPDLVVGRIPRERVLANELVRGERLADLAEGRGLNVVVPRGLRALSVQIEDGPALAGFLNPGDYVDALVTVTDPTARRDETRTLLQGVYVLGVDSRMGSETAEEARRARGTHRPTVTLLVDPTDAERVTHASTVGALTLTMRAHSDLAVVDPAPRSAKAPREKAPGRARAPVEVPVPACKEVWIYAGAKRTVLLVDEHGKAAVPGTCAPPIP